MLDPILVDAITSLNGFPYELENGQQVRAVPISQLAAELREAGWKRIPRIDAYDCQAFGGVVEMARYVGGVRPKRFCPVLILAS